MALVDILATRGTHSRMGRDCSLATWTLQHLCSSLTHTHIHTHTQRGGEKEREREARSKRELSLIRAHGVLHV